MIGDRGQTSFDFVVGMAVFLVTVGFVMTFIPGVFAPFTIGSGSDELVSDRAAGTLTEEVLVDDVAHPAILNERCTVEFFNGTVPSGCRFTTTDLGSVIGLPDQQFNVTILEPDSDSIATIDGIQLNKGAAPPSQADVTTARRIVYLNGQVFELRVRVW